MILKALLNLIIINSFANLLLTERPKAMRAYENRSEDSLAPPKRFKSTTSPFCTLSHILYKPYFFILIMVKVTSSSLFSILFPWEQIMNDKLNFFK